MGVTTATMLQHPFASHLCLYQWIHSPSSLPPSFPQSHNIQACIICDDVRNVLMTVHYAPARPPAENCHFPELFRSALVIFPDVVFVPLFALHSLSPNATDFHSFFHPLHLSVFPCFSLFLSLSLAEYVWAMGHLL